MMKNPYLLRLIGEKHPRSATCEGGLQTVSGKSLESNEQGENTNDDSEQSHTFNKSGNHNHV